MTAPASASAPSVFEVYVKADGLPVFTGTYNECGAHFVQTLKGAATYGLRPRPDTMAAPAPVPPPVAAPVVVPAPVKAAPVLATPNRATRRTPGVVHSDDRRTTDRAGGIVVSDVAIARIKRHEEMLKAVGIALPPPVYAAGSKVVDIGEDNFRTGRLAWEEQRPIIEGLEGVRTSIQNEHRVDTNVELATLRMNPDGSLSRGGGSLALEESGLRQLLQAMDGVFPRAMPVLMKAPPPLRADFFNAMMTTFGTSELADKQMMFRTRMPYGEPRSAYSVRSTTYGIRDADAIAADIIAGLQGAVEEARGEVVYDPATTNLRVQATWHAHTVVDFAAGDVFQLGATYSSNDAGGGSIIVDASAWRNLCLNLIIIGEAGANLLRKRHRGTMASVSEEVRLKTASVVDLFSSFTDSWGILRETSIQDVKLWGEAFATVPEALAWAVEHKMIDAEVKAAVMAEALLTGWKEEGGDTLADMINAVTRCHMSASINQWQREQMERAAGQLVPVLVRAANA